MRGDDAMDAIHKSRREAMKTIGALAAAGAGGGGCASPEAPVPVKWSVGTERPSTKVPANATDCHHHIYVLQYAWAPEATLKPGEATVADYKLLQKRIGTTRNVIVQPSSYGIDNRLLLASIAQLGSGARGVA